MTQELSAQQIDILTMKIARKLKNGDRKGALHILQSNEMHEEAALLESGSERLVQHELRCPAYHVRVATGCRLKNCKFWVRSDMANNCLLAYCHHQQVDRLNSDEIAYLYEQPIDEVKQELDRAMTTLRQTAIQNDANNDPNIERVFSFVETTKVCCVCGSATELGTVLRVQDLPLAYCSKECAEEVPTDVLGCEYRFGRPIETILRWAIHRFRNLPVLERTLGLKRETLIELSRRHLGRELGSFFPKLKTQTERPAWRRRTSVENVEAILSVLRTQTDHVGEQFGQSIFDIGPIRDDLLAVLV